MVSRFIGASWLNETPNFLSRKAYRGAQARALWSRCRVVVRRTA
jgi:hypothetical protein